MPSRFTRARLLNKISRELVNRFGGKASWFGYRHLRSRAPDAIETLEPAMVSDVPLPCNVSARDDLSGDRRIAGFSFRDVPHRDVQPTTIGIVHDCRVFAQADEWGDLHYALVDAADRVVTVRGTQYEPALHADLMRAPAGAHFAKATWILEDWDRNYAHWLQWHLTKIALLQQLGRAQNVILPPLRGFVGASVEMLGLDDPLPIAANVMRVDELTVLGIDAYRPSLFTELRRRFGADGGTPSRKLYISRRDATRRRLVEEEQCGELLTARGYERVFMEDYAFRDQVALMQEAAVVVALHGAGLANILFAPRGAHVVEIADVTFPNPQYYALCGALGHRYWLLYARGAGAWKPGYHDLSIEPSALESVLARIDDALRLESRS